MYFFIPRSFRVKHKILELLSKKRMVNGGMNPPETWYLTVKQISDSIDEELDYVNSQLDNLYYRKFIYTIPNPKEKTNPFCYVTDKGLESYSSFENLNEGKLLQTTLFNNLSTGFFQIIVGIIAVVTILYNYQDSKLYHEEVKTTSREVWELKSKLKQMEEEESKPKLTNKTGFQNNSEIDDIGKDSIDGSLK